MLTLTVESSPTLTHFPEWFLMIRDVSLIDNYIIYVSHRGWTNYS